MGTSASGTTMWKGLGLFVLLGLLQGPSAAQGTVLPYLTVEAGMLVWTGEDNPRAMARHVTHFWAYVEQQQRAGTLPSRLELRDRRDATQPGLWVEDLDLSTRSMQCTSAWPISTVALRLLSLLGCMWNNS